MKDMTTHIEFLVLLITLLGGFYNLDGKIERQGNRIDQQGNRIDHQYQIWVSTQKEILDTQKQIYQLKFDFCEKLQDMRQGT